MNQSSGGDNLILRGLNPAQREAVETLEGPLLILAGAGSGKTKVLTHRIANLITHGVRPDHILAVTFTNKAAKEMRTRLWKMSHDEGEPPRSFMPYMGTFHGICVRILRMEADAAGLSANFTIYDSDDQLSLIRRVMREHKFAADKKFTPKMAHAMIGNWKTDNLTPSAARKEAFYPNQKIAAEVYAAYEAEKNAAAALDFDDLLIRTAELFRQNAEVRAKWQARFEHILIDEYQDTNATQYQLVKSLVGKARNICVVGDDWQSIYSWRGADFTNILNFERDFPGAKVIKLEQNYRSTGNILAASQKIINHNKTRTTKTLFTEAGDGEPISIEALRDETAEANYVARQIQKLRAQHDYGDFAILYRTNAQSYAFEKAFMATHIPYKIIGGVRFYDRKEVKDVLAILKMLINPRDRVSFERITKNVLSGIGPTSLAKIFAFLDANPNATLGEAAAVLPARGRAAVMRLANFIEDFSASVLPKSVSEISESASDLENTTSEKPEKLSALIEQTVHYFDFAGLVHSGAPEDDERLKNLEVLASNADSYDSLEEFLADAALLSSADEASSADSVSLMTLHAAKGLEFPVVFVVGFEEGLFPSARAIDSEESLEEERRLAYVGMTRAMKLLFLTFANSRFTFGGRNYNSPSQFLLELGYNPYGSGSFGESGAFVGSGQADFGLLGGDPDGEFSDFGTTSKSADDFDPFPDDVPVFEY